ncbi:MAG: hypothetical protein ABF271_12765 [Abyssibacter sp.]
MSGLLFWLALAGVVGMVLAMLGLLAYQAILTRVLRGWRVRR